jgi:hypothetical protein
MSHQVGSVASPLSLWERARVRVFPQDPRTRNRRPYTGEQVHRSELTLTPTLSQREREEAVP